MNNSVKTIRSKCQNIIKKHDISDLPIDLKQLANNLNITIQEKLFESEFSGLLAVNDGKVTIAVNKNHSVNRKRFTIAHELGHFFLHVDGKKELFVDKSFNRDITSSKGSDRVEIEANRFAAELLMPSNLLKAEIKKQREQELFSFDDDSDQSIDDTMVSKLSQKFGVSAQAMEIRLSNMVLE